MVRFGDRRKREEKCGTAGERGGKLEAEDEGQGGGRREDLTAAAGEMGGSRQPKSKDHVQSDFEREIFLCSYSEIF